MKINAIKLSEKGDFRPTNQDRVDYVLNEYGQFLAIVCDGMGGHMNGERAAEIAITNFTKEFKKTDFGSYSKKEMHFWIDETILKIKELMTNLAEEHGESMDMGTTLAALIIVDEDNSYTICVGDSRVYRYANHNLKQLTSDQNLFNATSSFKRLQINSKNRDNPNFNKLGYWKVLTSALGPTKALTIQIQHFNKSNGFYLLTSDGVHDYISEESLVGILKNDQLSLAKKTKTIILESQEQLSTDNLSIIALEVIG